ncbi:bacteriohemerythrin [Candidatus Magnetaquicoccus inordinatus]|uniref:bacteriohemerythrin n=1 Tax=Candidatus Magnetaquicoccus inordinatus TaxID=2496818 RepID=UPI001290F50C|nr:hemerythrin family protein [Candidatus Magnetaquicoccus inordinatus]
MGEVKGAFVYYGASGFPSLGVKGMEYFHWQHYFTTGIGLVDEQHHHLVNILNHLGEMVQRQGEREEDIEYLFSALAAYAVYHFREEEELMQERQIDYRHFQEHSRQHALFLQEVTYLRQDGTRGIREAATILLTFLSKWLVYHILGTDQVMAKQVNLLAIGYSAEQAFFAASESRDPATSALLEALNGLFQQLSERNRELYELNQRLAQLLDKRTQELSEANMRLEEGVMDVLPNNPQPATPWYTEQEE